MRVLFHKKFNKKYQKLDRSIQDKADERIQFFRKDPFSIRLNNHALSGKYEGYRSINITGDYRAIYKHLDAKTIEFQIVDTHHNLYS